MEMKELALLFWPSQSLCSLLLIVPVQTRGSSISSDPSLWLDWQAYVEKKSVRVCATLRKTG